MRVKLLKLLGGCVCWGVMVLTVPSPLLAGRVPCAEVLRAFDRVVSRPGTARPDPVKIGKALEVEPQWVERCAEMFGRRLARKAPAFGLTTEDRAERWETEEIEEVAREEHDSRGEIYFPDIEGDEGDRRVLRRYDPEARDRLWGPLLLREWQPHTGHQWSEFLLDD